jgi:hypothetical protein
MIQAVNTSLKAYTDEPRFQTFIAVLPCSLKLKAYQSLQEIAGRDAKHYKQKLCSEEMKSHNLAYIHKLRIGLELSSLQICRLIR